MSSNYRIMGEDLIFYKLDNTAVIPSRETADSVGYELSSKDNGITQVIKANRAAFIKIGYRVLVPSTHVGKIAPHVNFSAQAIVSSDIIDQGYNEELGVMVFNVSDFDLKISPKQKIALFILERCETTPPLVYVGEPFGDNIIFKSVENPLNVEQSAASFSDVVDTTGRDSGSKRSRIMARQQRPCKKRNNTWTNNAYLNNNNRGKENIEVFCALVHDWIPDMKKKILENFKHAKYTIKDAVIGNPEPIIVAVFRVSKVEYEKLARAQHLIDLPEFYRHFAFDVTRNFESYENNVVGMPVDINIGLKMRLMSEISKMVGRKVVAFADRCYPHVSLCEMDESEVLLKKTLSDYLGNREKRGPAGRLKAHRFIIRDTLHRRRLLSFDVREPKINTIIT